MRNLYSCCVVLVATLALIACDTGKESQATAAPEKKDYVLSDREKAIFTVLLLDEIDESAKGRNPASTELVQKILGEYVVTTGANLQKEYDRNEIAGDQKFRNKLLLIHGIVSSIGRSFGENYFIALRGGSNSYITPKAAMADGHTNFLAQLQKGDPVWLACQGNGMLIGTAMLSNCEPLTSYAGKKASAFVSKWRIGEAIAAGDKSTVLLAISSIAMASNLQDSSTCSAPPLDTDQCLAQWKSVIAKDKGKEKKAVSEMALRAAIKKIGLDSATLSL